MVHPTNLLRTESDNANFAAPTGNYMNEIDCGLTVLPFLTKCLGLERFARFSVLVGLLSVLGFLQGVILIYFRSTSQLWVAHYEVPVPGWFIFANEISVGIFALYVAYWGNRIHRASWMGTLTIFLSISCATLAIPEIYNPFTGVEINSAITGPALCNTNKSADFAVETIHWKTYSITLAIILLFQTLFGMANVAFITLGMTYLDDHIFPKHSPVYIGMAFGASELGKQLGVYSSWVPYIFDIYMIFASPVWIIITVSTFVIGSIISLFPQILPKKAMMKSVNSLVSFASGIDLEEDEEVIDGFFVTVARLLKNKVLLLNIFSFVALESALVNFNLLERYFNQAKYHISIKDISGYSDPELIQFSKTLLKQPVAALFVLTSGMVIAKFKPTAKQLVTWNVFVFFSTALVFSATVFSNCTRGPINHHKNAISIPYCSSNCGCSADELFQPICVDGKTYFSPCLAGCTSFTAGIKVYNNCSCGTIISEGSCDKEHCRLVLAMVQANSVISYGLLASTVVPNIIINIRSVLNKDKAVALGLGMTFVGIIPYVPVKLMYDSVADNFCEIKNKTGCQYFSEWFAIFLSSMTIFFIFLAACLATTLLCIIRDLPLYEGKHYSSSSDIEIRILPPDPNQPEPRAVVPGLTTLRAEEEYPFMRTFNESKFGFSPVLHRVTAIREEGPPSPSTFSSRSNNAPHNSRTSINSDGSLGASLEAIANEIGDTCDEEMKRETNSSGSLKTSLGYIVLKVDKPDPHIEQDENIYEEVYASKSVQSDL
ncbi:unnamed protein product [Phaedon cochleariae]|uniref:Kazal-like domain-containing protein n=1 Tax=Phaedon cochleariae TaxID=80249 RepID=A0A9P0DG56_PHACE|nr:unnamed protein product [Phaedon cochleariae]